MFKFTPYVFKSLWRHRGRTMLTVTGSAVALFVFCFVGSVQQGLDRLTSSKEAERTLVVFQENRFCPASSKLPEDYTRTSKIAGCKLCPIDQLNLRDPRHRIGRPQDRCGADA